MGLYKRQERPREYNKAFNITERGGSTRGRSVQGIICVCGGRVSRMSSHKKGCKRQGRSKHMQGRGEGGELKDGGRNGGSETGR